MYLLTGAFPGGRTFGYDLAVNLTSLDNGTRTYGAANKITGGGFPSNGHFTHGKLLLPLSLDNRLLPLL